MAEAARAAEADEAHAEPQRIIRMLRANGTIYEQVDDIVVGPGLNQENIGNVHDEPEDIDEDEHAPLIRNA